MAKEKSIADVKDDAVYILQPGTPVYVKTADICALTGKSNQWIGQLVSQGTLFKKQTPHGMMFDLAQSMQSYCDMLESRSEEKGEEEQQSIQKRLKADAALKQAKATVATLEAKELMGEMHRSEDVAAMTEDLIFTIRGALMALPGRLAVDVISAKDSAEASDIIRREVYAVMEELSGYTYDAAKYQERVRERLNKSPVASDDEED